MCFTPQSSSAKATEAPETLDQAAPEKKTAKPGNTLAIGTKKYRSATPGSSSSGGYPSTSM